MLEHARKLSEERRAVYIVADNERHADMLRAALGDGPHGIKVETPGSLGNFDWMTLTLRGAHPNCVVLVDHYAIESRFARLWQMMHAYDSDGERAVGDSASDRERRSSPSAKLCNSPEQSAQGGFPI